MKEKKNSALFCRCKKGIIEIVSVITLGNVITLASAELLEFTYCENSVLQLNSHYLHKVHFGTIKSYIHLQH